ncbi:hypothetical protein BC567DRAFT_214165 [Phyllosticta citribraziliensis]
MTIHLSSSSPPQHNRPTSAAIRTPHAISRRRLFLHRSSLFTFAAVLRASVVAVNRTCHCANETFGRDMRAWKNRRTPRRPATRDPPTGSKTGLWLAAAEQTPDRRRHRQTTSRQRAANTITSLMDALTDGYCARSDLRLANFIDMGWCSWERIYLEVSCSGSTGG